MTAEGMRRWCSVLLPLASIWLMGCVTIDYVGTSYPPTAHVDLYMSAADVQRPYQVIGDARAEVEALPFSSPGQQLQEKLLTEARSRGANGVILGQLGERQTGATQQTFGQGSSTGSAAKRQGSWQETTTTSVDEVTELRARFIRYTD